MAEQLGDAPIEPAYADKMKAISFLIDGILNGKGPDRDVGFVLPEPEIFEEYKKTTEVRTFKVHD